MVSCRLILQSDSYIAVFYNKVLLISSRNSVKIFILDTLPRRAVFFNLPNVPESNPDHKKISQKFFFFKIFVNKILF